MSSRLGAILLDFPLVRLLRLMMVLGQEHPDPLAWSQLYKIVWAQTPQYHRTQHRPEEVKEAEAAVEADEAAEAVAKQAVYEEHP